MSTRTVRGATIALGTHVACTSEAFIIRRRKMPRDSEGWRDWEIPVRGNFYVPVTWTPTNEQRNDGVLFRIAGIDTPATHLVDPVPPERHGGGSPDRLNKSIAVIDRTASGIVVDRVLRQWGVSEASYGGGEDYEEGYFHTWGSVRLYVVKSSYESPCFYVPEDSIVPAVLA